MADFADQISDEQAGRRLARAIRGEGVFGRFKRRAARGASTPAADPARLPRHARQTPRCNGWQTTPSPLATDPAALYPPLYADTQRAGFLDTLAYVIAAR